MTNPPTIAMIFLLLFRILFTIVCVTSYTHLDHFAVNCGGSGNSPSDDGRNWTGDIDCGLFHLFDIPKSNYSSVSLKALGNTIPYNTARLSRFLFSYWFPAKSDGQKFIRLYFYPSSYDHNFLRSNSFFSVSVGSHTLLEDFNASITADDTGKETIFREYYLNIVDPFGFSVAFTPNPSHPNAYAFVNGIEVVSMPTFLYYTNPEDLETEFFKSS